MVASSRTAMAFEITGHKTGLEGAFVRTQAHTAADALRFAREWAEQGLTGITMDDCQHHGRWPACRPELKARSAPPMRPNLAAGSFGSTPQAHSRSRTGAREYGEALHQLHWLRLTK